MGQKCTSIKEETCGRRHNTRGAPCQHTVETDRGGHDRPRTARTASFKYLGLYATLHSVAPGLGTEGGGDVQRTRASGLMAAARRICPGGPMCTERAAPSSGAAGLPPPPPRHNMYSRGQAGDVPGHSHTGTTRSLE
uniref:Uncharacterized protein n=1 Tax=Eutreptiella gymnastica TaxID=73025 RepID=A0A7S4FQS2_9EUGL